jgi:hypothetical protein
MTSAYYIPLSGLIGALIGAGVALWISWANRRVAAIEQLLAVVYALGFRSYFEPDGNKRSRMLYARLPQLWGAYAALRAVLPWWQRPGLDTAWYMYIALAYYEQIPADDPASLFHKPPYDTVTEAPQRSAAFIRYLLTLRRRWVRRANRVIISFPLVGNELDLVG